MKHHFRPIRATFIDRRNTFGERAARMNHDRTLESLRNLQLASKGGLLTLEQLSRSSFVLFRQVKTI